VEQNKSTTELHQIFELNWLDWLDWTECDVTWLLGRWDAEYETPGVDIVTSLPLLRHRKTTSPNLLVC